MSHRIAIQNLLNPLPDRSSESHSNLPNPHPSYNCTHPTNDEPIISVNAPLERRLVHQNYQLNSKTKLVSVYQYPPGSTLEYPETGSNDEAIGHIFGMDLGQWYSPGRDFAYSRGPPKGNGKHPVTIPLLVDSDTGEMVPCIVSHSTCRSLV